MSARSRPSPATGTSKDTPITGGRQFPYGARARSALSRAAGPHQDQSPAVTALTISSRCWRRDFTHEEDVAFWARAIVEVLRHTGIRIEELLELTHHSFVAYTLPTSGEVVPMLQTALMKTDRERLLLISPELSEVLTATIFRVRAGQAALPLVSACDVVGQVRSPPMPFLFQRRHGTEHRALTHSFVRTSLTRALTTAALTDVSNQPLTFTPRDFRRLFITDAIRTGLPPHIAAAICGHQVLDTAMGCAAICSDDVIVHHRAFIARRRAERPGEEYRSLTPDE
ncbi:tyrosine-type recombinase/integrase [Streptomyces sp. NPDC057557]|uniref:tyrosine-type recombinase/integrase n=1 Tax=Streptomyces sp. NPDC057557 TaxID=3346167 RepID=UPI0036AD1F09